MMPSFRSQFALAFTAAVCMASAGCTNTLSQLIVSAPNYSQPTTRPMSVDRAMLEGVDHAFQVPVGPPDAMLQVSVIDPKPLGENQLASQPRGTVLVLHGIYAQSSFMTRVADELAAAGYRAVLVDLRGHGNSSGRFLTYGQQEARDLSQVIDALAYHRLIVGHLGVYGISYGGATAIQLAGLDPRVKAVVSVAAFSTMRDAVPGYVRSLTLGLGWLLPDSVYQNAIDKAGEQGGYDPDLTSALTAIQKTNARVLLIHGQSDLLVSSDHAVRMREAARDRTKLVLLPFDGHTSVWLDRKGEIRQHSVEWFGRWLD
jgi:pimeloyl-ACP methyl ester carboxylesterase